MQKNETSRKREWTKPELIVLVRSTPEQSADLIMMGTCKVAGGGGAQNGNSNCQVTECDAGCSGPGAS